MNGPELLEHAGARLVYGLPYKWSSMRVEHSGSRVHYTSRRSDAMTDIEIEIGDAIPPASLTAFDNFVGIHPLPKRVIGRPIARDSAVSHGQVLIS